MPVRLEITEGRSALIETLALADDIEKGLAGSVRRNANLLRREVEIAIRAAAGSGQLRRGRGRGNRASAPGQTPVSLSGELARSFLVKRVKGSPTDYRVVSDHVVAFWLEAGTSTIRPRSLLSARVERYEPLLTSGAEAAIDKAVEKWERGT